MKRTYDLLHNLRHSPIARCDLLTPGGTKINTFSPCAMKFLVDNSRINARPPRVEMRSQTLDGPDTREVGDLQPHPDPLALLGVHLAPQDLVEELQVSPLLLAASDNTAASVSRKWGTGVA